jgi:2-succinyl-6-hydroxy-2,4-cyclohexadiene-1-carboxylate synthase
VGGEPLVLLHGFTQTAASWDGVVAALEERYRPLAPDLRGHGAGANVRPVTFAAVIADVLALAPGRFVLAGYSMGGRLALLLALAHPERVARLVLLGATAGIEDPAQRAVRRAADEALAADLERDGIEAFARRWARLPLWAGQPAAVAERAHAERLRQDPAGLAAALRGLGTGAMTPVWDRLHELELPVVAAAGERDERFAVIGRQMAARMPHGRVALVPGAGHAAHLEAPAAVAALIDG